MPVERVGGDTIEVELARIGTQLGEPATLTLFGGCSMTLQGIKSSTQDVDAVLALGLAAYPALEAALVRAGYEAVETLVVFDNYVVFTREGGITLEVFPPERIFDVLRFSEAMAKRAVLHAVYGALEVRLADPSTMFLFKSVTGRWRRPDQTALAPLERRDLEDLAALAPRVDWRFIQEEWGRQVTGPHRSTADENELAAEAVGILRKEGFFIDWNPAVD